MSLQVRLADLITSLGTDYKQIRSWITGSSTGDLTSLTTTNKTSVVAAINEVKAGNPSAASETVAGIAEIATQAETNAGTDDARIVTPAKLKAVTDALLDTNNAVVFKGLIDCSANPNYPAANAGHFYKVSVAGKIGGASGINVEVGDSLYCLTDNSVSGNQATVGANWDIVQTNIDGAVVGPASSTSGDIVTFSGTSGKTVQDSAVAISTDGTLAANSDAKVSTEKAVKTYAGNTFYTKTELGDPETDLVALYTTAKA